MEKSLGSAEISTLTGFRQELIDAFIAKFTNPETSPIPESELMNAASKTQHAQYLLKPISAGMMLERIKSQTQGAFYQYECKDPKTYLNQE